MTVVTPRGRALRIAALCISSALASGFAAPALAQLANDNVAPPPVRQAIDENGVDIIRGTFNAEDEGASIGSSQPEGLSFKRFNFGAGWRDSQVASLEYGGPGIIASIGGNSDSFSGTTATEGNGATLTSPSPGAFLYTNRDGVTARFVMRSTTLGDGDTETYYTPSEITYPNGTKLSFNYQIASYCLSGLIVGKCGSGLYGSAARLSSITNNYNYQLKFSTHKMHPPPLNLLFKAGKNWLQSRRSTVRLKAAPSQQVPAPSRRHGRR